MALKPGLALLYLACIIGTATADHKHGTKAKHRHRNRNNNNYALRYLPPVEHNLEAGAQQLALTTNAVTSGTPHSRDLALYPTAVPIPPPSKSSVVLPADPYVPPPSPPAMLTWSPLGTATSPPPPRNPINTAISQPNTTSYHNPPDVAKDGAEENQLMSFFNSGPQSKSFVDGPFIIILTVLGVAATVLAAVVLKLYLARRRHQHDALTRAASEFPAFEQGICLANLTIVPSSPNWQLNALYNTEHVAT